MNGQEQVKGEVGMAYEIGVQVRVENIGGLTFGGYEALITILKRTRHTVGSYDESGEMVGYWGVGRGSIDGVNRCHGFVWDKGV